MEENKDIVRRDDTEILDKEVREKTIEAYERRKAFLELHGKSRLIEVRLLYLMHKNKDWDILGFDSFKDFVEAAQVSGGLDISRSWANELIHTYAKYVVELGLPEQTLIDISPRKLYFLKDSATEENIDEILSQAKTIPLKDLKLVRDNIDQETCDHVLEHMSKCTICHRWFKE